MLNLFVAFKLFISKNLHHRLSSTLLCSNKLHPRALSGKQTQSTTLHQSIKLSSVLLVYVKLCCFFFSFSPPLSPEAFLLRARTRKQYSQLKIKTNISSFFSYFLQFISETNSSSTFTGKCSDGERRHGLAA